MGFVAISPLLATLNMQLNRPPLLSQGLECPAMYDFKVDAHTRLLIAQALLDNETISIIELPNGSQLRVICHFGHVALELITCEKDLFGDVCDQVGEVLHG
jgi:hypothetical protein